MTWSFINGVQGQRIPNPKSLYPAINLEFTKVRSSAGFVERKDNSKRHLISLNSFRSFVQTTISNSAGQDFAEWFLGHAKSPYWKTKPEAKREIYLTKCVPHLTFLDYSRLEVMERSNEAGLLAKEEQIAGLRQEVIQSKQRLAEMYHDGMEEGERKDREIHELKEQVEQIRLDMENLIKRNITVRNYTKEEWEKLRSSW
jgi:hypothetical protein